MKKREKVLLGVLLLVVVLAVGFLSTDLGQASIFRKPTVQNVEPEAGTIFRNLDKTVGEFNFGTEFHWISNANGYTLVGHSLCFEKANPSAIFCSSPTMQSFLQVGGTAPLGWDDLLTGLYGGNWPAEANLNWYVKGEYKKKMGGATFFVESKVWPVKLELDTEQSTEPSTGPNTTTK